MVSAFCSLFQDSSNLMYLHATTKNEKARNASHGTGKPHAGAIYTYTAQSTISSSACYFDALHFLSVLPRGKLHQSNVLPDINDWFYYVHERRRWRNPRRQKGLQLCHKAAAALSLPLVSNYFAQDNGPTSKRFAR